MAGMSVTAYFGASSETVSWAVTGAGAGSAVGSSWSINESGDTFGGSWNLASSTTQSMTRLVINGQPGDTMFDVAIDSSGNILSGDGGSSGVHGTDGSALGWTFDTNTNINMTATYRNAVALGAATPVGDLYTTLDMVFTDGLAIGAGLSFISDTDSAETAGDITPSVPEPTTFIIWSLLGAIGLTAGRYRRRKAA